MASALAQPLQHQHHEHKLEKKDVKVVTATNVVKVTKGDGQTSAVAAPTTLETQTTGSGGSSTETDSSAASSSGSDSLESGSFSAGSKGITYTPYSNDGGCKSSSQIQSEVKKLSGFEILRLYGVDCDQVKQVLKAKSSKQKLFIGVDDVSNLDSGIKTLSKAVGSDWDQIDTISIGNELVNSGEASASEIGDYIKKGKAALKKAGFKGHVVSVDTFIAVVNNPDLCKHSDYIAVNAHAFFDGHASAKKAGKWVLEQIQKVASTCGDDKKVVITESGWPSSGDSNGDAVPSESNQKDAIDSIKKECGDDVYLFTAFNDMWKDSGKFNVEKYWGIYKSN